MASIKENIAEIKKKIAKASERAKKDPGEIKIVAATKYVGFDKIKEANDCGITCMGENKVQDALKKYSQANKDIRLEWHMIGHLQTNKVKKAVDIFSWFHSIDSIRLVEEINSRLTPIEKIVNVLIEVNMSGEGSKYGIKPEDAEIMAKKIIDLPKLELKGLMTMAPISDDPEESRPYFKKLRDLSSDLENKISKKLEYLSMGMTDDFEVAIEEGANIVRIGRGIFG